MPAEKDLIVSAAEAQALFSDLEQCPALLLAVSGGPDSIALMVLVSRWVKTLKRKPELVVGTIDHGLRAAAKREASDVARLARKLGLTHRTLKWTGKKPATGLQQAARLARYRLLGDAARKAGAPFILTAHTLDDQAETVLIRMSRGSGITGLAAMQRMAPLPSPSPLEGEGWGGGYASRNAGKNLPPSRRASRVDLPLKGGGEEKKDANEIFLLRPLLDIPKARLIATLRDAKIPFAVDPSNRDPRFTRARLRGLMPQLAEEGLDARRLSLLAQRLRRADEAIEAMVDKAHAELTVGLGTPGAYDAAGYFRLPDEIALRLLGRAVGQIGDEGPVELGKLEALFAALKTAQKAGTRRYRRSLAGALVMLAGLKITVERAPPRQQASHKGSRPQGASQSLTKGRARRAKPAQSR